MWETVTVGVRVKWINPQVKTLGIKLCLLGNTDGGFVAQRSWTCTGGLCGSKKTWRCSGTCGKERYRGMSCLVWWCPGDASTCQLFTFECSTLWTSAVEILIKMLVQALDSQPCNRSYVIGFFIYYRIMVVRHMGFHWRFCLQTWM